MPAVSYPLARQYEAYKVPHLVAEPVPSVVRLDAAIAASMDESRTIGYLVGAFALLALLLAAVGRYGLVSYGASQRVREIGIRIAPGTALERLLFGVEPSNVGILGLGALFLMGTAALGSWLPAWRASRGDAAVTLREGG